jgi:hypothetical protein
MSEYLADVILMVMICSIPYLVFQLRLHSSRGRKVMYDSARHTAGMREDRI